MPAAPRGRFADDAQAHRRANSVRGAHRVAVHQGAVERRQIRVRRHVFGEHAPARFCERNLHRRKPRRLGEHDAERFGDGK